MSLAVVPPDRHVREHGPRSAAAAALAGATAGPWAHVEPPPSVPAWIGCDGFAGVLVYTPTADSARDAERPTS